jgi:hypothetical protein
MYKSGDLAETTLFSLLHAAGTSALTGQSLVVVEFRVIAAAIPTTP